MGAPVGAACYVAAMTAKKRVGILISGRGSNMEALIAAARAPDYPAEIVVVVSNRPDAAGLKTAEAAGIPTQMIDHKTCASREAFESELDAALLMFGVELVACAGFMRLMTPLFVTRWQDRMINIHPSLLPAFKGLDTHARALAAGVKVAGCTVHVVRPEVDEGPIIAQAAVPVLDGDTPETLAARVLDAEHRLYPHALALYASGEVKVDGSRTAGPQVPVNQEKALFWPPLD
jgi:phosphoribosylglycinamide formyltransferase-1